MDAYSDFLKLLDIAIQRAGNAAKLADAIGVNANLLTRWKNRDRTPNLVSIQPVLDYLSAGWNEHLQKTGEEVGVFSLPEAQAADEPCTPSPGESDGCKQQVAELEAHIMELEAQVRTLEVYKHKWEGYLEAMRAQGGGRAMPVEKRRSA